MSFKEHYKLKTNPFRITPATSADDLVWAGFSETKEKFIKRIKRNIRIPNSTLVLNWGEYGSGKTHAARFFNKFSELEKLAKESKSSIPYSMVITLPKGKEPVFNIYTSVIDKLNLKDIREKFREAKIDILSFIDGLSENMQIQSVLRAIFNDEVEDIDLIKKYLYGNITNTELKKLNKYGILRHLNSDSDYTKLLAGLFTCITHKEKVYSTVIIWFDEFEDLSILSSSNIDKTNNFLREILDNTPNNLLIFLNLTQTALFGIEDLGEYLNEAVKSRIKERINFDLPTKEQFKNYLTELLDAYREGDADSEYYPFEEGLVNKILEEKGNVSLRSLNEAFSLLLELADIEEEKAPITVEFFEKNRDEILGWKEE